MSRDDPFPLKNLLGTVLSNLAQSTGSARALKPIWDEAVGEAIGAQSWPIGLTGATLTIEVAGPSWATELRRREPELKQRLRTLLGGDAVRYLEFRVRQ